VNIVVSPYHLTTREPAAMAALLLAEKVFTLLPASLEDPSAVAAKRVAERSPWYSRFMESWSWTIPLWEEGVLFSRWREDDLASEMRAIAERLRHEEQYLPLRPLLREQLYESDHTYLSYLGADLLKGGPDPGITVPLSAALDRFARRHECFVARGQAVSVVQKAEAEFASSLGAIAVPMLLQGSGEQVLLAREILEPQLGELRLALAECSGRKGDVDRHLSAAAGAYARAFDANKEELATAVDDEIRPIIGSVVVSAVSMPADVVLRSSLIAVELLGATAPRTKATPPSTTLPLPVRSTEAGSVVSLVIKPMGAAARHR
jgi:hypothetical protein